MDTAATRVCMRSDRAQWDSHSTTVQYNTTVQQYSTTTQYNNTVQHNSIVLQHNSTIQHSTTQYNTAVQPHRLLQLHWQPLKQKSVPSPGHATSSGLQPGAYHRGGRQYRVGIVWCRVHWQLHFQPDSLLHARSVVGGILDTRH
jgi:hypothetical protein